MLDLDAPAAALILVINVCASLFGLYRSPQMIERHLFRPYWFFRQRQYVTVVSSGFLHADVPHLLFNMFTLWAFAFPLEPVMGTASFVALYAFGLLVSGAGTYVQHRNDPGYRCLGASGAVLAVLFASIVYFPTASLFIMPIPVPIPAPLFAVGYIAYSWYASKQNRGRINHDAHWAGAVAGLVFVALTEPGLFGSAWARFAG